jgi:anthranilate phosphoribosyltransferase
LTVTIMTDSVLLRATLDRLLEGENLSQVEAAQLLTALTAHDLAPALAGALLAALRGKGVTADEPESIHRRRAARGRLRAARNQARQSCDLEPCRQCRCAAGAGVAAAAG